VRIAYFTAGTVGAGHAVRGLAVARGLAREGFRGELRFFGPRPPFPLQAWQERAEVIEIQHDPALRHPHLAAGSELATQLRRFAPDLLLVDLFWTPLRWILPRLTVEAWLLARSCPPVWWAGPPESPFAPEQFRRIIAIEPLAAPPATDRIDPVVVANPEDCRPPGALRERLGVPAGQDLTVVVHAGERGELPALLAAAPTEAAARFDLATPDAPFPASEWLGGADHVVAGAGYNSFWEAHWLGYAERTTFVPFRRTIDDQARRAATRGVPRPRSNGADVLASWILSG
jgi:hypothetical protein